MKITLAAIGKHKADKAAALFDHYAGRLPWKITLKELDAKKQLPPAERKIQEGVLLQGAITDADTIIALDEHGKDLTSTAFAQYLQKRMDQGLHNIAFVIGGADGLDAAILKRAHLNLSFGRVTWPHMLMRALLAEQLYRAYTILNHHPYHRE